MVINVAYYPLSDIDLSPPPQQGSQPLNYAVIIMMYIVYSISFKLYCIKNVDIIS